jgi:adhesin transport system membrane fusion protein
MNAHPSHLEDLADRIKPRAASNVLLWIVGAFFVAFFVWASLTKLDRTVKGGGRVVASSHMQIISNLEGGIVQAILVRVGQQVRRGQELIQLDRTQSGSELGSGQSSIDTLAAKIARLSAEITGRNPVYPASSSPEVQEQIRIEQSLHASRMAEFSAIVNAGRARVDQAMKAVQEAQSLYSSKVSARDARQRELAIIRPLVEKGIEPRMSLSDAEAQYAIASSDAAASASSIARARASVAEAQSATRQQQQDWRSLAANELATAQGEYAARRNAIPALAEKVARTSIRSPLPGHINRVLVTTVGSAVAPGAPLVEIVPSEESLLVEAMVRPQDIAFVRLGQKARVNITAYDPSVYGSLHGNVVAIAPDVIVNEKSGESFYTVQIRTTANALKDRLGRPLPIGTGMTADVSLIGDKRTVLQYILTPITRLTETAFRE